MLYLQYWNLLLRDNIGFKEVSISVRSCINFTQTTEIECTLRSFKAPQAAKYLAAFSSATRVARRNPLSEGWAMRRCVRLGVSRPRSRELAPSQADWLELASFLAAASRRLPGHDLASTRLLVRLVRYCARELSQPRFCKSLQFTSELLIDYIFCNFHLFIKMSRKGTSFAKFWKLCKNSKPSASLLIQSVQLLFL